MFLSRLLHAKSGNAKIKKYQLRAKFEDSSLRLEHRDRKGNVHRPTADDLEYVSTLSTSNFNEVLLARDMTTGTMMVAKAYDRNFWRSEYLFRTELRLLEVVKGRFITEFLGYLDDINENFLLFRYYPNGDLAKIADGQAFSEMQTKFYAAEMFLAIDTLHAKGFMHREIKLSNFLIDNVGHIRLCDFGLSYQFRKEDEKCDDNSALVTSPVFDNNQEDTAHSPNTVTFQAESLVSYCAPEMLGIVLPKRRFQRKAGYSHLCDYWSLGVVIYRMLFNRLPFFADTKGCTFEKVLQFRKTLAFPLMSDISVAAMTLINELLRKEKHRLGRRGLKEVKAHAFFGDLQWNMLGTGIVSVPVSDEQVYRYCTSFFPLEPSSAASDVSKLGSGVDEVYPRDPQTPTIVVEDSVESASPPSRDREFSSVPSLSYTRNSSLSISRRHSPEWETAERIKEHKPSVFHRLFSCCVASSTKTG